MQKTEQSISRRLWCSRFRIIFSDDFNVVIEQKAVPVRLRDDYRKWLKYSRNLLRFRINKVLLVPIAVAQINRVVNAFKKNQIYLIEFIRT